MSLHLFHDYNEGIDLRADRSTGALRPLLVSIQAAERPLGPEPTTSTGLESSVGGTRTVHFLDRP